MTMMKIDALNDLRTYWETLRDGRVAPYRAELDPREFEDARGAELELDPTAFPNSADLQQPANLGRLRITGRWAEREEEAGRARLDEHLDQYIGDSGLRRRGMRKHTA